MPRIDEITGGQTAIAGLLKAGLTQLSGDQHVTFNLYRKLVSPLDGQVYWLRVLADSQTATVRVTGGLANQIVNSGRAVQAVPGGVGAQDILGGKIINPATAEDQGLPTKMEPIYVSLTGPASHFADAWSTEVLPGDSFDIPAAPALGVWVSAPTAGHKFSVALRRSISALSGQPLAIEQSGSLHFMSETEQEEDNVSDTNTVVFTSKDEIRPFNQIGPEELYIGERTIGANDKVRFSFSSRGHYYEAADLWHYMGVALQFYMEPLVIDDPAGWEPDLYVTNSLPIWLTFPGYMPPYPGLVCPFPVYPSYLAPDNVRLPYASIHIEETRGLAATPSLGRRMQHDQLVSDRVKVTLYGATARKAADFYDFAIQFMRDSGKLGLMQEVPELRDEHQKQVEFRILAQKKVIGFEVSYLQSVARDMARQVINSAMVQLLDPTNGQPLRTPIVENADVAIDWPREEAEPMAQVTERLFRAATMPIMTQAMKPPPIRVLTEPVTPPDELPPPPDEGGEEITPKSLGAASTVAQPTAQAAPRRRRKPNGKSNGKVS
jgi:hypothetical protein